MLLFLGLIDTGEGRSKFEQIYNNYRYTMLYIAKGIVKDDSLAEDVVHDSFLKIIERLDDIEDVFCSKTKSFIIIIARNKAIDIFRKIKRENQIPLDDVEFSLEDDSPMPVESIINEEGYNRILGYIGELDEKYRAVLELKYLHEYSEREISNILDITEKNANIRIFRARKMLKSMIEGNAEYDKS